MRIDSEDLRRHYDSLSDEALLDIDPTDLTEVAQKLLAEEIARRGAAAEEDADGVTWEEGDSAAKFGEIESADNFESGPPPDWLDDSACATSFGMYPGRAYAQEAAQARAALRAAGIPCYVLIEEAELTADNPSPPLCQVMVPGVLAPHATSVLDRDIFNAREEANWRTHLEELSDHELGTLNPDIFCAGLLDRAQRLRRAYIDEVARRTATR